MLSVTNLEVRLPSFSLRDVSFHVDEGEFFFILGPSGAGKTVLLETLAGLHRPRQGRILMEGKDLTFLPPEKRPFAIVYQDYALFPHLTVEENIRYPLRFRRPDTGIPWRQWVEVLGIGSLLSQYPHTLSGGERQRVALARALAACPRLLLLDEPLVNLHPALRGEIGKELKRLNRDFGLTTIMVTHDFSEVFSYGERVAVLIGGQMVQIGTPEEVFRTPVSPAVAGFVGLNNLIPLVWYEGKWHILGRPVETDYGFSPRGLLAGVRPEDVRVSRQPLLLTYSWPGEVKGLTNMGPVFRLEVEVDGFKLDADVAGYRVLEEGLRVGAKVYAGFATEHLCFLPGEPEAPHPKPPEGER
ncbi:MAG: ABC transporter ATP-binding protein [Thermoanaerobacteraceae bacterium]|nr:ABC transporter ATP-binding protein [Thermoanaerobacteraceae bacterium]